MPQLTRQLRVLGIGTVAQQRLYVGAIHIRVGRRGHGIGQVEIVPVGSCHLRLHVQHRVGEIQVIVAHSGSEEFYRSTRVQRGHGLMFHYATVDDAVLSGGTVKRSSSVLTPSHDCLCTKAIVVIEYVGFTFRGRLSLASSLC